MSDAMSFAELDGQHVELLPSRTVLSLIAMTGDGGTATGGAGGTNNGNNTGAWAASGAWAAPQPAVSGTSLFSRSNTVPVTRPTALATPMVAPAAAPTAATHLVGPTAGAPPAPTAASISISRISSTQGILKRIGQLMTI
jgi:hypothetical protein